DTLELDAELAANSTRDVEELSRDDLGVLLREHVASGHHVHAETLDAELFRAPIGLDRIIDVDTVLRVGAGEDEALRPRRVARAAIAGLRRSRIDAKRKELGHAD